MAEFSNGLKKQLKAENERKDEIQVEFNTAYDKIIKDIINKTLKQIRKDIRLTATRQQYSTEASDNNKKNIEGCVKIPFCGYNAKLNKTQLNYLNRLMPKRDDYSIIRKQLVEKNDNDNKGNDKNEIRYLQDMNIKIYSDGSVLFDLRLVNTKKISYPLIGSRYCYSLTGSANKIFQKLTEQKDININSLHIEAGDVKTKPGKYTKHTSPTAVVEYSFSY